VVDDAERAWLAELPKIELHLHLEGAIPYDALWELVRKYGGDDEAPDVESLRRRMRYRDFPHFIETWVWKNGFLREYEDFRFIAEAIARDLGSQNIRYVEAFYSPGDFARHGLEVQQITVAIRRGLAEVEDIEVRLIADLIRDSGPENAERTLLEVGEVRDQGVIGIGIGGSEHEHPPEPFAEVYERARSMGFHTTAHAGEAAGPDSVWGAIRALRVDRIGHGARAAEDPELVRYLAEQRIPVELCPLSNVRTGVVDSVDDHPVLEFIGRGLLVCINTDDPKMFHNSLVDEFSELRRIGLDRDDVLRLILNGIRASWLPDEHKAALSAEFSRHPAWDRRRDTAP
jgi:adenosine deaminase